MNHDIEKALDNLEKRAQDIQHYMNIMSKVKTVNVADDQDFQREFDFFYKVRRNAEWRKVFFEIFERKKKKNCSYKEIITEGTLKEDLLTIQKQAEERMEKLISQMAATEGVTEQLKEADQMLWVAKMNNIQSRAEEVVLSELVYSL